MYVNLYDGYGEWVASVRIASLSELSGISAYLYGLYWPQWTLGRVRTIG